MNKDYHFLSDLKKELDGELYFDSLYRKLFATDASVYREMPIGVAYPKHKKDVQKILQFANRYQFSVIPRAAGTSLAGQVVGNGLVVDCSKHFSEIIEINTEEKWVRVQPGVVLDELNQALAKHHLFFGPETSTSTHCTIGGMFGNNSCGSHSIIYGSTRQHVLEAETVLSNGEIAFFKPCSKTDFTTKVSKKSNSFQSSIYAEIYQLLKHPNRQQLILDKFPPQEVIRRNTGYALDELVNSEVFLQNGQPFNVCKLLAGSEGTLAFTTELKLNLVDLPPTEKAVICLHHHSISDACQANLIALECRPTAVELMDDVIIKMARQNPLQREKSKFIADLPKAVLLVEFMADNHSKLEQKINAFLQAIKPTGRSYHHVVLYNDDANKVWELRKAGLGVLGNMVGDKKPVALVEDTAVAPEVLTDYIAEFEELMTKYGKQCVFYAHISAGEIHLRPVLNLKEKKDRELFYQIGKESAQLVAKYKGSISGEHGDGRLRGEFIPLQYGEEIVELFQEVKAIFDPNNIFNPGKIVHTPPMNEFLRYEESQETKAFETVYDFSADLGLLRAAEKCNGMGFCRKSEKIGGTMCPSFQATRNEKDTTRARANTLREVLTTSTLKNVFESEEIAQALDLCLSCKACKSECPSSVDMAKLKSEVLQQKYLTQGVPFRTKMLANSTTLIQHFPFARPFMNKILSTPIAKSIFGIAKKRKLPTIQKQTLKKWYENRKKNPAVTNNKTITLFNDEFINFYDTDIGKKAVLLLEQLGFHVQLFTANSGRTHISKGLLLKAQTIAKENIRQLQNKISKKNVLVGLEPSTILSFRDEYIDLLRGKEKESAKQLASHCFTIEEFLLQEMEKGNVSQSQFKTAEIELFVHGHCQQKAMIGNQALLSCLQLIPGVKINEIASGCCGMAGSFGYEKEHYQLSMQIGNLVLFPEIMKAKDRATIIAPGTSCRHQIQDGTDTKALHPVELLFDLVKKQAN